MGVCWLGGEAPRGWWKGCVGGGGGGVDVANGGRSCRALVFTRPRRGGGARGFSSCRLSLFSPPSVLSVSLHLLSCTRPPVGLPGRCGLGCVHLHAQSPASVAALEHPVWGALGHAPLCGEAPRVLTRRQSGGATRWRPHAYPCAHSSQARVTGTAGRAIAPCKARTATPSDGSGQSVKTRCQQTGLRANKNAPAQE